MSNITPFPPRRYTCHKSQPEPPRTTLWHRLEVICPIALIVLVIALVALVVCIVGGVTGL